VLQTHASDYLWFKKILANISLDHETTVIVLEAVYVFCASWKCLSSNSLHKAGILQLRDEKEVEETVIIDFTFDNNYQQLCKKIGDADHVHSVMRLQGFCRL
jgi:hypothetical protein